MLIFSARPTDYPTVEEEIRQADCVVVVYAVNDNDTFHKVKDFWLPEIRRLRKEISKDDEDPVIK